MSIACPGGYRRCRRELQADVARKKGEHVDLYESEGGEGGEERVDEEAEKIFLLSSNSAIPVKPSMSRSC